MGIELAKGTCGKCGSQGPIIGKREKALCPNCYQDKIRQPKPGSTPKPRQPIKIKKEYKIPKISEKQKIRLREYTKGREVFLKENTHCQIQVYGCTGESTQCHHPAGRIGDLLCDFIIMIATCDNCHRWAELNPEAAKELGVSKSRLHD